MAARRADDDDAELHQADDAARAEQHRLHMELMASIARQMDQTVSWNLEQIMELVIARFATREGRPLKDSTINTYKRQIKSLMSPRDTVDTAWFEDESARLQQLQVLSKEYTNAFNHAYRACLATDNILPGLQRLTDAQNAQRNATSAQKLAKPPPGDELHLLVEFINAHAEDPYSSRALVALLVWCQAGNIRILDFCCRVVHSSPPLEIEAIEGLNVMYVPSDGDVVWDLVRHKMERHHRRRVVLPNAVGLYVRMTLQRDPRIYLVRGTRGICWGENGTDDSHFNDKFRAVYKAYGEHELRHIAATMSASWLRLSDERVGQICRKLSVTEDQAREVARKLFDTAVEFARHSQKIRDNTYTHVGKDGEDGEDGKDEAVQIEAVIEAVPIDLVAKPPTGWSIHNPPGWEYLESVFDPVFKPWPYELKAAEVDGAAENADAVDGAAAAAEKAKAERQQLKARATAAAAEKAKAERQQLKARVTAEAESARAEEETRMASLVSSPSIASAIASTPSIAASTAATSTAANPEQCGTTPHHHMDMMLQMMQLQQQQFQQQMLQQQQFQQQMMQLMQTFKQ